MIAPSNLGIKHLAVTEQQSFDGAARHLGMTTASVTCTTAALEARLGVQLLVRTTRQVSLTSASAIYAARAAPLADGLTEAANATCEAQGIVSGRLRISAPLSLGVKVLPTVLSQFGGCTHRRNWMSVSPTASARLTIRPPSRTFT